MVTYTSIITFGGETQDWTGRALVPALKLKRAQQLMRPGET